MSGNGTEPRPGGWETLSYSIHFVMCHILDIHSVWKIGPTSSFKRIVDTVWTYVYLLTYLLTPWSRFNKFPAFYGTRRFITAFTSARRLSLSWGTSIQSIRPISHFLRMHFNIILPSTPGSSKWSLSCRIPHQNLCMHISYSPIRATCPAHLILLDFITRKILSDEYRALSFSFFFSTPLFPRPS